ncbi:MAG: nucleotidyltransferase domain-containing protein [Candidatus Bathyarchaeota archaeon]|nr:nucleotidyltransferase domain-containing protein [Candidatus Bathyarchaeota archaeon]
MSKKPLRRLETREVVYDAKRWALLEEYRRKAMHIMDALEKAHLETLVYGSIARGDVTEDSDVDVFIPNVSSSFTVDMALEKAGIAVQRRMIVQATPTYAVKAYMEIDDATSVSFPLMKMRKVEREFYRFGGEISLSELRQALRKAGVDKRLMLVEPTEKGHLESAVVGQEVRAAKVLGISCETALDRIRVLLRRDKVGRTGVFVKKELSAEETFETTLDKLVKQNPAIRRRLLSLS